MMTAQVAHAVSILIVRRARVVMMIVQQRVVVSEIAQIVRRARVVMTIVHKRVVVSEIAQIVRHVRVVMMTVRVGHAVLMIVQHALKPMRSVAPIKFVHAQVAVETIAMQHRATITNKSVGRTKVQHEHRVVDRAVVTTTLQSIWSVTRSVHQHQPLPT
jgi:hypothetical protein